MHTVLTSQTERPHLVGVTSRLARQLIILALATLGSHFPAIAGPGVPPNEVTEDNSPIFTLSYRDADDEHPETVLWIYPDGSVHVADSNGVGSRRGQLNSDRLNQLVEAVVRDDSALELDSNRIRSDVMEAAAATGRPWRVSNPVVMQVRLYVGEQDHEIECPCVDIWHERFPDVDSVARLSRIRQRLENVRAIVQIGGWDVAEDFSRLANRELLRNHPDATPVTAEHLAMVRGHSSELRYVQFVSPPSTVGGQSLMISVFEFPNRPVRVTVAPISGS